MPSAVCLQFLIIIFFFSRKTCYSVFYQNTLQGKLEIVYGVTLRKAKIVPELHSSKFALHIHKEVRYRNVFRIQIVFSVFHFQLYGTYSFSIPTFISDTYLDQCYQLAPVIFVFFRISLFF